MSEPKPWFILPAFILSVMMVQPWNNVTASTPTPPDDQDLQVVFTGHLNADTHIDSVFGYADVHFNYLPRLIRWGEGDSTRQDAARQDKHVRETTIAYPAWETFSGSVAFKRLNADTLTDIILYMWGRIGKGRDQRDTMRAVTIFGQKKLDKVSAIDIGDIGTFQEKPFFAMELRVGTELIDPKARDISGRRSYERLPVDMDVEDADTAERAAPMAGVPVAGEGGAVRVYPNPAGRAVRIEGEDIPPGRYSLEIVAVDGGLSGREEVVVEESRRFLKSLDMRRIPSGRYVVRLLREGVSLWSDPIIITR